MTMNPESRYRLAARASVGLALAAWLVASFAGLLDPNKLPPVQALVEAVSDLVQNGYSGNSFWAQVGASMGRALAGFVLAVLVGVPVGIFIGSSRMFDAVVSPYLTFLRPIPPIALVAVSPREQRRVAVDAAKDLVRRRGNFMGWLNMALLERHELTRCGCGLIPVRAPIP